MLADGARIASLQERLGRQPPTNLRSHLTTVKPANRSDELTALSEAVDFFERSVGSLEAIGFGAIVARAARQSATTMPRDSVAPERRRVGLDHNWTETGHRVTLVTARRSTSLPVRRGRSSPRTGGRPTDNARRPTAARRARKAAGSLAEADARTLSPATGFRIYPHELAQDVLQRRIGPHTCIRSLLTFPSDCWGATGFPDSRFAHPSCDSATTSRDFGEAQGSALGEHRNRLR